MSLLGIVRDQHLLLLFAVQLVTSFCFIYYGKNKLSFISEILLIISCVLYHKTPFNLDILHCYIAEYILLKLSLVLIVYIAKRFAFFILVVITHKEKYKKAYKFLVKKKRFLRFQSRIWNKVKYGIRIKKGIPSMVNKRNTQHGISFDSDGFPKFKVITEVYIDSCYWKKSRDVHFYQANRQLYTRIKKYSKLSKKFTKNEIKEFKQGNTPKKYTWHHHQDKGLLQLVDSEIHAKVRHNGGFSIWGPRE